MKKLTTSRFIEKAIAVHGDRYDYSKVVYCDSKKKIEIVCKTHGSFFQRPNNHWEGQQGCPVCAGNIQLTTEIFIYRANEIHGEKYDYSKATYVNNKTKIAIICAIHGIFQQTPIHHLYEAKGCDVCGGTKEHTTETFIEQSKKIHGEKYDYSKATYVNNKTKIAIICAIHGIFQQTPNSHLCGSGCFACRESSGERKIANYLDKKGLRFEREKRFESCKLKRSLPFDFYIADSNILIEFDGRQHFQVISYFGGDDTFALNSKKDNIKTKWAFDNGYKLIRIPYMEKDNIELILDKELS